MSAHQKIKKNKKKIQKKRIKAKLEKLNKNKQLEDYVYLSWGNLANAVNDEKNEDGRYIKREKGLHEAIKELKTDSFCAMEFRKCLNDDKSEMVQPEQLGDRLSEGTGLEIATLRPQNLDEMCFWRGTFYNKKKLKPLQSFCKYAVNPVFGSKVVAERGVMLLFTQYVVKKTQKVFWVINVHMPMALPEKLATIKWLNDNAVEECKKAGDPDPLVFCGGDMNTFFKDLGNGAGGQEMMDLFSNQWVYLTSNIEESFKAFKHDPLQITCLLDHIFVNKHQEKKYKLIKSYAIDTGMSDHYFMNIVVRLL
ncbi:MAG: hypothetical protein Dasosvirus4_8 [Dasosvirus sp.]|uniref:Endonuclease/exonuclease/phosphatase domain-containing protein n=1 Tax=Dasosvirus sp. TaxID=2487764 RepID=A0A3G4ZRH0_9VIRU|nr:MAG: hypothetical protein Dasosvirus4_8 [Dasosvirus sp.]